MTVKYIIIIALILTIPLVSFGDNFYGNNNLNPLIKDGAPVIHLPGNTEVKGTEYILKDHRGDLIGQADEMVVDNYETETQTQNVHARQRDPSIDRFLSVDSKKEDSTPYSYAGNNSPNYTDFSGNEKYNIWLYSRFGVDKDDGMGTGGVPSQREHVRAMRAGFNKHETRTPWKQLPLETVETLGDSNHIDRLTISIHGSPRGVNYFNYHKNRIEYANGKVFAKYFLKRLSEFSPGSAGTITRILFDSCGIACNPPRERWGHQSKPFLDKFTKHVQDHLPNLKTVAGSSYQTSTTIKDVEGRSMLRLNIYEFYNFQRDKVALLKNMSITDFLTARIPNKFFNPPNETSVNFVGTTDKSWQTRALEDSGGSGIDFRGANSPIGIRQLLKDYGMRLPIFRKIQVRPEL